MTSADLDILEEKMIRVGAFNPDDLVFNQAGELSPRQRRWLRLETIGWFFQIAFYLALILFAWVFFYIQGNAQIFWLGSLAWTVGLGSFIWICFENILPSWNAAHNGEVKSISGPVLKQQGWGKVYYPYPIHRYKEYRLAGTVWSVSIREQLFTVSPSVYKTILENQTYRIFYIPSLKRAINIELVAVNSRKQSALAERQEHAKEKQETHP